MCRRLDLRVHVLGARRHARGLLRLVLECGRLRALVPPEARARAARPGRAADTALILETSILLLLAGSARFDLSGPAVSSPCGKKEGSLLMNDGSASSHLGQQSCLSRFR